MAYSEVTAGPGKVFTPKSRIELTISCKNLADKDVFSKSDPLCVLFVKPPRATGFVEHDRTEVVKDSLNPTFKHKFVIDYMFEEVQELKFQVYDSDSKSSNLKNHEFLGEAQCRLSEIVGKGTLVSTLKSSGSFKKSSISIRSQEVAHSNDKVLLQFHANNLDKKDFLGKSDPYVVLYRENMDRTFTVIHKTEVIQNTLNPKWRAFQLPVQSIALKSGDADLKIEIYDWDKNSSDDLIGICSTSFTKLKAGPGQHNTYEVINPKKKSKKSYKNSGTISLTQYQYVQEPSFLDFIQGGLEINLIISIDFTQSNGHPQSRDSLHYYTQNKHSQYGLALYSVGEILQDYDHKKRFPALGFGGLLPNQQVSHCFFLNGSSSDPDCLGIPGIMQAYYSSLQTVNLYGPTNFSPCINYTANRVRQSSSPDKYTILLIITDGIITDMHETIRAIIDASFLPLSIIIVGVGRADFSAMDHLDADKRNLSSGGRTACRDIVQFVPFQSILDRYGNNIDAAKAELAKCVLAEVPQQVIGYMKFKNIKPSARKSFRGQPGGPEPQGPPPANPVYPTPGAPSGPSQNAGQLPYPGQNAYPAPGAPSAPYNNAGQAPYPGQNPYPGSAPIPGAPPASQQNSGYSPYPGSAPLPGAPPSSQPSSAPSPYPGTAPSAPNFNSGQAPYPSGGPSNQVPYPGGGPMAPGANPAQAPYPGGGFMAPSSQASQSPYPNFSGSNSNTYPTAPPGNQQGQSPYPNNQQHYPSPYPNP
ncbi:DgyrCDS940 [Dimorphilus gyrociliatus]|uniref:Copine-3 n=1 Tax=Dimorphilus gyrociliatus TaxID=2664684 RepID=A0A7I8V5S8_9ANNE|nr:DgyrCDS940 [Dimorphilus gyrociliatus]